MTNCRSCKQDYDEADTVAVQLHAEAAACTYRCNRCKDRPECYPCGSSFCFCGTH
ncbi:hypothetical protein J3A78_002367 [Streptomyces sp. PvR006]|nr:hypothetical protein [Streptomyces sp. PvR006]